MDIKKDNIVTMKKIHPCKKSNEFKIIRIGVDVMCKCIGCESIVTLTREKFNKRIKELRK